MNPSFPYASVPEQQLAMAILAHAARRDRIALAASLHLLSDPTADLSPVNVAAVMIAEWQRGIDVIDPEQLARWFSRQALSLADQAAHQPPIRSPREG